MSLMHNRCRISQSRSALTLTELLVSMGLLTFLMLILSSATESAGKAWREGQSRTDTYQSARTALELMARELGSAVVDTRMQFIIGPSKILADCVRKTDEDLADKFAPGAPVALWMAPLGKMAAFAVSGIIYTAIRPNGSIGSSESISRRPRRTANRHSFLASTTR